MRKTILGIGLVLVGSIAAVAYAKAKERAASPMKGATCGQMLAQKAALPAKMAELMTAVADMMTSHADVMSEARDNRESMMEAEALRGLAKQHKLVASEFQKTAEMMKGLATLPGAPHDAARFSNNPKVQDSMKRMLATHKEMVTLMQQEIAQMESMMRNGK